MTLILILIWRMRMEGLIGGIQCLPKTLGANVSAIAFTISQLFNWVAFIMRPQPCVRVQ